MEYIPPKDAKSDTEDRSYADDVQDRAEDEEWTPKSKKRKMNQGKSKRDEVSKSTKEDAGDKNEQCLLKEPNDNDAAVAEGQNVGGRHECSCSVCKKRRGEEEEEEEEEED